MNRNGSAPSAYFPERYGELVMPVAIALAKGETVAEESLSNIYSSTRTTSTSTTRPGELGSVVPDRRPARPSRPAATAE